MPTAHTPLPTALVIFGASGNLSQIKLLPALYELLAYNHLPKDFTVVAVFRNTSISLDALMDRVELAMLRQGRTVDQEVLRRLRGLIRPITMDSTNPDDYDRLRDMLDGLDTEFGVQHQRVYYLAIPPKIFMPVIECLSRAKLNIETDGVARRIFVEKPFGRDLASATELIEGIKEHFSEHQIYRIDHYLAKETAQNILTFRFRNPLIKSIWNREGIDYIHIRALEKIGIEGRADFYEGMGALRDLIQSHLLQLMALVMMDAPREMKSTEIHEQKAALLEAIKLPTEPINDFAIRAQYDGYREEARNPDSQTETYALLRLDVDLPDWHGVPVLLETGKALDRKETSIEVVFRDRDVTSNARNILTIRIQPDEGISLQLATKKPGFTNSVEPVTMAFSYESAFAGNNPEAYERVLYDAIVGDQTLFAASAEVLRSWEIIEPVIRHWEQIAELPPLYKKGSHGPTEARAVIRAVVD